LKVCPTRAAWRTGLNWTTFCQLLGRIREAQIAALGVIRHAERLTSSGAERFPALRRNTSNALRSVSAVSDFVSVPGRLRLAISASTLSLTFFQLGAETVHLAVIAACISLDRLHGIGSVLAALVLEFERRSAR